MTNRVKELVEELKENYPDYTDEHIQEYVEYMKDEHFGKKEIEEFIAELGY